MGVWGGLVVDLREIGLRGSEGCLAIDLKDVLIDEDA